MKSRKRETHWGDSASTELGKHGVCPPARQESILLLPSIPLSPATPEGRRRRAHQPRTAEPGLGFKVVSFHVTPTIPSPRLRGHRMSLRTTDTPACPLQLRTQQSQGHTRSCSLPVTWCSSRDCSCIPLAAITPGLRLPLELAQAREEGSW